MVTDNTLEITLDTWIISDTHFSTRLCAFGVRISEGIASRPENMAGTDYQKLE